MRKILANNKQMQQVKYWINYPAVVGMVEQHPDILGDIKNELVEIQTMAAGELKDEDSLHVVHGDFWTGK